MHGRAAFANACAGGPSPFGTIVGIDRYVLDVFADPSPECCGRTAPVMGSNWPVQASKKPPPNDLYMPVPETFRGMLPAPPPGLRGLAPVKPVGVRSLGCLTHSVTSGRKPTASWPPWIEVKISAISAKKTVPSFRRHGIAEESFFSPIKLKFRDYRKNHVQDLLDEYPLRSNPVKLFHVIEHMAYRRTGKYGKVSYRDTVAKMPSVSPQTELFFRAIHQRLLRQLVLYVGHMF